MAGTLCIRPSPRTKMLAAWTVESLCGYPHWLYRRIRHPVVWIGARIAWFDRVFNRSDLTRARRFGFGMAAAMATVALAMAAGFAVSTTLAALPNASLTAELAPDPP